MKSESDTAEAVFVSSGIVIEAGTEDVLRHKYNGSIDRIIDVRPYTIFPGFEDSHLHVMAYGMKLRRLNLTAAAESGEMENQLKEYCRQKPVDEWVFGEGWNENNWSDRKIFHKTELDELAPVHPVVLTRICRHALIANSRALAFAEIDGNTENPEGGVIVKDANGEPTGLLLDKAMDLLLDRLPVIPESELEAAAAIAIDKLLQKGLIGGHTEDLAGYGDFSRVLKAYEQVLNDRRRFKIHLLVHHEVTVKWAEAGFLIGPYSSDLSFGAMKIFADGALGGRTAWLREPYNDAPETSGISIHQQNSLNRLVAQARNHGLPAAIHAIGDRALEAAVTAIESVRPLQDYPDRLIHGQLVPPDLQDRISRLHAVLDIQPSFVASDFPWVVERLGIHRLSYAYAWKTLLDKGLRLAGGSDAPIEDPDPVKAIYTAITRENNAKVPERRGKNECLTPYEAVSLYTLGSAYAAGASSIRGKIAPDFEANFTILTSDLMTCTAKEILNSKVVMTVIGDRIVYENPEV